MQISGNDNDNANSLRSRRIFYENAFRLWFVWLELGPHESCAEVKQENDGETGEEEGPL